MKGLKNMLLLLLLIGATTSIAQAQKESFIGLNFTVESSGNNFTPGFGVLFERRLTTRSGFETGLYYRNYLVKGYVTYNTPSGSSSYAFSISERHLSIPALYKFYSRIFNVTVGPTFDFYLGWKQKHTNASIKVDDHSLNPNLSIGLLAKVSKKIRLNDMMFLEPEFRYNRILSHERYYMGFGIAGKYRLR